MADEMLVEESAVEEIQEVISTTLNSNPDDLDKELIEAQDQKDVPDVETVNEEISNGNC